MKKFSNSLLFWTIGAIVALLLVVAGVAMWQREQKMSQVQNLPPTSVQSSDPTAHWQTYRDKKYGFEFKYPEGWKVPRVEVCQTPSDKEGIVEECFYQTGYPGSGNETGEWPSEFFTLQVFHKPHDINLRSFVSVFTKQISNIPRDWIVSESALPFKGHAAYDLNINGGTKLVFSELLSNNVLIVQFPIRVDILGPKTPDYIRNCSSRFAK